MKSKLFAKHDLRDDESFERDIKHLLAVDPQVLGGILEYAFQCIEVLSTAEKERICDKASDSTGLPRASLDHVLSITQFLLRQFTTRGDAASDDPSTLVEDLQEMFDLPTDSRPAFLDFFTQMKALAESKVEPLILRRAHSQSTLPIVRSVSTAVDYRVLFDEDYATDKDLATFSPTFMGLVPVGIVQLVLSAPPEESVFFQASKRSLQVIIDHLKGLQKQIDIAEKHINVKQGE